ncbi:tetratricopeptide repeat protein [Parasphingorhabdus sp. NYA22]
MKTFGITILLTSLLVSTPVAAQNAEVDKRVDRLEQEMRAVQRKVFPGGSTRYFEPEITAENGPASPAAAVTTSAVSDLIARVDTLERSLANLTGQVEENGFRLKKIEDRMAAAAAPVASLPAAGVTGSAPKAAPKPAAEAAPDPKRVVGVAAIVMPETGDAAEDAYIYGYRLWDAKFYPEAQTQLKKMVEDHPTHRRASFAQNLLGRAYLDDSKPALASVALYENYQKRPRGERAPDSLYFLSTALVQLGKKTDACRVLAEMQDVYPEVASGRLADRVTSGKAAANCK